MINKTKPKHRKMAASKTGAKPSKKMSFDKLYRMLYAHPKMVEDLIVNFVKEQFVEHIDFTTLKDCKTKFVTDRDGIRESDIRTRTSQCRECPRRAWTSGGCMSSK